VLDKAEYSAFQSTLNSSIVSYRMYGYNMKETQHTKAKTVSTLLKFTKRITEELKKKFPQ